MFGNWNKKAQLKLRWLGKAGRASLDGQPRAAVPTKSKAVLHELVAAGVVLGGHQHKAGARRSRLGLRWMSERAQDAEHCDVSSQDAEADGSNHGEAEDNGHQEGNHGFKILVVLSAEAGHFVSVSLNSVVGRQSLVVSRNLSAND
jgi:hypothetical protein